MKRRRLKSFYVIIIFFLLIAVNTNSSLNLTKNDEKPSEIEIIKNTKEIKIIGPLCSVPVFVEKGKNTKVTFQTDKIDRIFAYIETAYEPIVDEIWLDFLSVTKKDLFWEATFSIPIETPEELYNLTIIVEKDGLFYSASTPRSVSVYDSIGDDFSFVHITDFHVGDPRGFLENFRETIGYRSIKKCISEINLIHPDFVLISGDLVFGQLYPFEYKNEYKKCYEMIQLFDVPTFLVPGNHDGYRRLGEDGLKFWNDYFGPHYHSFDFGNYHFIGVNSYDMPPILRLSLFVIALNWGGSISQKQMDFISDDLNNTSSNMTFMYMHHNPIWDTKHESLMRYGYKNREKLLSLINKYSVDMVLAGHIHIDTVETINDTIYLTTTTPQSNIGDEDGYWGYRLIEIKNDKIVKYNYKEPKYSIPSYKLSVKHNDVFKATITNDLETDLEILTKFIVPLGNYYVENGDISMIRKNNFRQEIYVNSDVLAESELVVNLTPTR
jgi:3',5'-cyclic AMP phosphodiesterase CpdA